MSEHKVTVSWKRDLQSDFTKGKYSREHRWTFDGGVTVPGSSSPSVVPVPFSNPSAVDPEEAFVASISSCHMLCFLSLAAKKVFTVDTYEDHAVGVMTKGEKNVLWVSEVTLRPKIIYSGSRRPTELEEEQLHHEAHKECFIANSIRTNVVVAKPQPAADA
jgi:organic hydroperoxide reductase OsmC/OhrA